MDQLASWIATVATILAACLTASNLGSRITGYGFIVFTIGSIAWFATGYLTDQPALIWTNIVMTGLNLFGVWRWLGRQARVEEGAEMAAEKSRELSSETLFPASWLSSAKVVGIDGKELGTCVDAMLGCSSGQLSYLVTGQGGVAGVGETFRRIDWRDIRIHEGSIHTGLNERDFKHLPELAGDDWPGR
jgi:sporulation protein YlmC with PRC-barrel domain